MERGGVPLLLALSVSALLVSFCHAGFYEEFTVNWGAVNVHPNDTGGSVEFSLTADGMGSTFSSSKTYLFGSFKVQARLVQGDSSGTVAAFFLISETDDHDEIDFEFLGNQSGKPYLVHTNVFANGVGEREQDIYLWFDPTLDYHTYQVLWNHELVIWLIDDIPVRLHKNIENIVPNSFPKSRPMVVSSCIYDASTWATQGGAIPIDYTKAPFNVNFQNFTFEACTANGNLVGTCTTNYNTNWWEGTSYQTFNNNWANQMAWVRKHYQHYDYCSDTSRNPTPPVECSYNQPTPV